MLRDCDKPSHADNFKFTRQVYCIKYIPNDKECSEGKDIFQDFDDDRWPQKFGSRAPMKTITQFINMKTTTHKTVSMKQIFPGPSCFHLLIHTSSMLYCRMKISTPSITRFYSIETVLRGRNALGR